MRKIAFHTISGMIRCVSGLRVGGSDELLQAGAADLSCIKNPVTLQPYIPGSSLKGRLRSEMEFKLEKYSLDRDSKPTEPCGCGREDCLICRIFGAHKNTRYQYGPSRLIPRDAQPSAGQTIIYEIKTESANNRQTGAAHDPRKLERVPAGTTFDFKFSLQEWNIDAACSYDNKNGAEAMTSFLIEAMRLVEATGIGSGIGRGSGEIRFEHLELNGVGFSL
jgi:CRISPR-associated protein Csm3